MLFFNLLKNIKKSGLTLISGVLILLFLSHQSLAQKAIWLSNSAPPNMVKEVKATGMHRYSSLKGKKRGARKNSKTNKDKSKYNKTVTDTTKIRPNNKKGKKSKKSYRPAVKYLHWIRKGSSIKDAEYICLDDSSDYELTMISPKGKKEKIELVKDNICYTKFELNEEGYHNAYLIIKKNAGDTLHINVAKAELLSHSCRNGHHKKLESRPVEFYPEITDFEMIRIRHPHEDYHYFAASGNIETYRVMLKGEPLKGVKVTINTEKGWSKTLYTNENGEINTQFIQDYFSSWQELNNRKIYYYMIEANFTLKKDINYNGNTYPFTNYTLTMSDGYRPSRTMYASMVWALVVFLTVIVVSSAGILIYKERRRRPFKEITFSESKK